jgi:hypothetical protein
VTLPNQRPREAFESFPVFGRSTGWSLRNFNHANEFETISASSGPGVGNASIKCYDVCNFTGKLLEAVKVDPDLVALENRIVELAKANPSYGKTNFFFTGQETREFGGKRWSSPDEAWASVSRANPLLHKSTWMVAANALTWVLRHAQVKYMVEVDYRGAINIEYRVYDQLDLTPQNERGDAYNNISGALGHGSHGFMGANPNLQTRAAWKSTR